MRVRDRAERWMFDRLRRFAAPLYGYRPGVVWHVVTRLSLTRSACYSLRARGPVLCSRSSRITGAGRVHVARQGMLVLGIEPAHRGEVSIDLHEGAQMTVGGFVTISRDTSVVVAPGALLAFEGRAFINAGGRVDIESGVHIGTGFMSGQGVMITDTDHHFIHQMDEDPYANARARPIVFEEDVWIGTRAVILKGVTIARRSVVAAGSVVTSSTAANTLVGGVPARVIRDNISWAP